MNTATPCQHSYKIIFLILFQNQPALTENAFAKNLLMGGNDSDDEDQMILQKPMVKIEHGTKKYLAGPKSKKLKDIEVPEEGIVLTADKMMKKELEFLHAPVVMKEEAEDEKVEIKISPDTKPVCIIMLLTVRPGFARGI